MRRRGAVAHGRREQETLDDETCRTRGQTGTQGATETEACPARKGEGKTSTKSIHILF